MSLINDMLRDLEARRADDLRRPNLQGEVRPLPNPARTSLPILPILLVLLVVGVAGGIGWWLMIGQAQEKPAAPLPPVALPDLIGERNSSRYELRPATTLSTPPVEAQAPAKPEVPVVPLPTALPSQPQVAAGNQGVPPLPPKPVAAEPATAGKIPAPPVIKAPQASSSKEIIPPPEPKAAASIAPVAALSEKKAIPGKARADGPTSIEVKTVLSTPRERADAEYRAAQASLAAGRSAEAADQLRAALKQDSVYVPARQALFRLLLEQRKVDEAMTVLNEGLELQPQQLAWAMSLARLQVERTDLGAAQRTLARSAPHAGSSADYAGFYGHVLYRLGHYRDAVTLYQGATRLVPGEGRWWFGLAVSLEGEGRAAEAKEAYRQALATGTLSGDLASLAEQKLR